MGILPKSLRTDAARQASENVGQRFVIPAGRYIVALVGAEEKTANSGAPRISFRMQVVSDMDGDETHKGATLFEGSNVDEKGAPYIMAILRAFGLDEDADMDDIADAAGSEAVCRVTVGEWNGEPTNDVRGLQPLSYESEDADPSEDPDFD